MKKISMFLAIMLFCLSAIAYGDEGKMVRMKMNLKSGWNLVGSVVNNSAVENISNTECIYAVWKWNNEEKNWEVYSPDSEIQSLMNQYQLKKMEKINEGDGFWINVKEDCEVDILGEPPTVDESLITTSSVDTTFETTIDTLDTVSEDNENVEPVYSQLLQNAEIVEFTGTVKDIPEIGSKSMNGFVFTTDLGEDIVLYGLGPAKFWEESEIDRPVVGDNLTIDAFKVTLDDGSVKYIIKKITDIDGNSLTLRDDTTGLPVWAKGMLGEKEEEAGLKKQYRWGKNR